MLDIFHQDNKIAESTNVLFKIGFYLINMGFALVIMELKYVQDMTGLAEDLSSKIGGYSMYLGFILLLFLLFFLKGRKSARLSRRKLQES
jgi:nitrate reductase gamma subunit